MNLYRMAQHMRNNPTPAENKLWQEVRARRFHGYRFRRQHVIMNTYIADFYCRKLNLIVEVDGLIHSYEENRAKDIFRDTELCQLGYQTIRFSNDEVLNNMNGVLEKLSKFVR